MIGEEKGGGFPLLRAVFEAAARNREKVNFLGGDRSKGYEELLGYLGHQLSRVEASSNLPCVILLRRALHDYCIAAECLISGIYSVALDCMRDVMEVEFLLRDFRLHPGHAQEWLSGTEDDRRRKFEAGKLRKRYADIEGVKPQDLRDTGDYRIHSMLLHVGPRRFPGLPYGLVGDMDPIAREYAFADIFEHARRLIVEVEYLVSGDCSALDSETYLPAIKRACVSTQALSAILRDWVDKAMAAVGGGADDIASVEEIGAD